MMLTSDPRQLSADLAGTMCVLQAVLDAAVGSGGSQPPCRGPGREGSHGAARGNAAHPDLLLSGLVIYPRPARGALRQRRSPPATAALDLLAPSAACEATRSLRTKTREGFAALSCDLERVHRARLEQGHRLLADTCPGCAKHPRPPGPAPHRHRRHPPQGHSLPVSRGQRPLLPPARYF